MISFEAAIYGTPVATRKRLLGKTETNVVAPMGSQNDKTLGALLPHTCWLSVLL